MDLDTEIKELPKIGPILHSKLSRLKIRRIRDLIYHLPFRYDNIGAETKISNVTLGNMVSVRGEVTESKNIRTKYGKLLTIAKINDGTDSLNSVWFNQPFLLKTIRPGQRLSFAGKVDLFSHKPTLINPEYELEGQFDTKAIHTRGLIPIYPETSGLSSKWFRSKLREVLPIVLPKIEEFWPSEVLKRNSLIPIRQAIYNIHFPEKETQVASAKHRLAFDELVLIQLKASDRRKKWNQTGNGVKLSTPQEDILKLISNLPFTLTTAQKKSLKEILADIARKKPMNRLLQGDVGSGKTIVAAIASYVAFLNGYQIAFMAPTELLVLQHFNTIKSLLEPIGVKVGLKTASKKTKAGDFDIVLGTHSLISKKTEFKKLALVIIDEQHRFGVEQRALLRKKGLTPHVLTMTATPIPRSLALTLYGDLDISIMDELPPYRKKVKTFLVPKQKRNGAYEFIRKQVKSGRQVFIIFPLIEPSETLITVKAATKEYEKLKNTVFPDLKVGLLHGRLASEEKEKIIGYFSKGKYDILVSTPVVEVGVDIPNATVMVIEGAERFGLASLHQLRGRVGRSSHQSFCLLFTESSSKTVTDRLSALEKTHSGLKLAELDLKLRGPGQIYGLAQSGIPELKIANIGDINLIKKTREEADYLFHKLKSSKLPTLKKMLGEESFVPPD